MKALLERLTWVKIVEGSLLIILGILIAVLGGLYQEELSNVLAICIAVFLFVDGLITLASFWLDPKANFNFTAVLGCLFITIGVVLCVISREDLISTLLTLIVAIMLLTVGGVYLVKAIIQIVIKAPLGWILVNFLIAVSGITLGIISLYYFQESLKITFILIGIAVTVLGVLDLTFAIIKYRNKKKEGPIKPDIAMETDGENQSPNKIVEGKVKKRKGRKPKQISMDDNASSLDKEDKKDDKIVDEQ